MYISDTHLKSFLSDANLVSQKDFDSAEKEAKDRNQTIGDILIGRNLIGEDELRRTYAYILGIPFISLAGQKIPYDTLSLIPEPVARRNNIVAYNHKDEELDAPCSTLTTWPRSISSRRNPTSKSCRASPTLLPSNSRSSSKTLRWVFF